MELDHARKSLLYDKSQTKQTTVYRVCCYGAITTLSTFFSFAKVKPFSQRAPIGTRRHGLAQLYNVLKVPFVQSKQRSSFYFNLVRESLRNGCNLTSHWALIGTSVSHILLTINSSVNFVIYCFLCTTFRGILYHNVNRWVQ